MALDIKCRYANSRDLLIGECHHAECHCAECHCAGCHYAECHGANI